MSGDCVNLKFPISQIQEKHGLSASLSIPPATLFSEETQDVRHDGALTAALDFSVGGSRILLQVRLAGAWIVACSRCLKKHSAAYDAEFDETYPLTQDVIDVSDDLRQNALLEIPQRSLCSPDCQIPWGENGREPGQPDSPAPRSPFDALKKLKEN